jgi:hypothetical protein
MTSSFTMHRDLPDLTDLTPFPPPEIPSGVQLATVPGGPQRPLQGGQDLLITRQALDFEAGQSRIGDLRCANTWKLREVEG